MITEIELENVRIFAGSGWKFPLKPLTVFCGTNSAGKSTILKSLLLLKQSQGVQENYNKYQGRLRLVGSQVNLVNYSSFVSHNDVERDIVIGLTITSNLSRYNANLLMFNDPDYEFNAVDNNQYLTCKLRSVFTFGQIHEQQDRNNREIFPMLKNIEQEIHVDNKKKLIWQIEALNNKKEINYKFKISQENLGERAGFMSDLHVHYTKTKDFFEIQTVLSNILPSGVLIETKTVDYELVKAKYSCLSIVDEVLKDLGETLSHIDYLSALRSNPKPYYLVYLSTNMDIDSTGESIPYLLKDSFLYQAKVLNLLPNQTKNPRKETLAQSLNSWLYYLRTGESPPEEIIDGEIEINTQTSIAIELNIRSVTGKRYPLADSGFGYSQLLPILVKGLLANQGSTLIVEQPEAHLNPALQVRIAEFFVAMIRLGKQILVETHSEHIVNTIRVLSAEDETGKLASQCGIFFLDTELTDKPEIQELSIQPDGIIPNLPQNFFGEAMTLSGRLLKAQRKFREVNNKK